MRALTVQQPWAWAIAFGPKSIENRTQQWRYRGPLAIHAGQRVSARGIELVPDLLAQDGVTVEGCSLRELMLTECQVYGAIIATTTLLDVHPSSDGCCDSPWAETSYDEHGGKTRRDVTHLVLDEGATQHLRTPIPCRGALGLWTPPPEVLEQLRVVVR